MRRLPMITPATVKARAIGEFHNIAQWELALKILAAGSVLLLLSAAPSFAQMAPLTPASPAMGTTSPLGVPGATSTVGSVGIPLGATELSPGGLSPMMLDPTASANSCFGIGVSAGSMTTAGSTFDSAGIETNTVGTSAATSCNGVGGTSSGTTTSASTFSGSIAGPATGTASVGTIPLGSTELNNGGVSPMVTSPALSSPCAMSLGASTTPLSSSSTGMTGTTGSSC